jgi:high-affinity K+ transport system ATPase subunit B
VTLGTAGEVAADSGVDHSSGGAEPGDVVEVDADAQAVQQLVAVLGDEHGLALALALPLVLALALGDVLAKEPQVGLLEEVAAVGPAHW